MIEVTEVKTPDQVDAFETLVDEFRAWDTQMSREIGLNIDTMVEFLYESPKGIAEYGANGLVLLVAYEERLAGCGALKELSPTVAELTRVYVRPVFRGKGLGKAIVGAILSTARERGFRRVCLETAIFMNDAHALYKSFGFEVTPPFRDVPADLKDAELFMELAL